MLLSLQLLTYALLPAVAMVAAGVYAVFRAPGPNLRSALLHFAAGVVFAVLAIEFLPVLVHDRSALATGIGFALGVAAMLAVRSLTSPAQEKEQLAQGEPVASSSLLFASGVDIAIDGLMLGIGFAAGAREGVLLTLALTFELVSLGLAIALELLQGQADRGRALRGVGGLAVLFIVSAGIGSVALKLITGDLLVGVIAFGAAALLFLVTEELLTEAHEVTESPLLTAMFFVGFLAILLLELLS